MKSVSEIKEILTGLKNKELQSFIDEYCTDERTGVKKLVESAAKKKKAYEDEIIRLENMMIYERKYADFDMICGIDEAGRGPLCGPVVAGAVILPKGLMIAHVNDSKKLTAAMRDKLFDEIREKAVAYSAGIVWNERIDEINILNATYEAMRQAIEGLKVKPDLFLNDAVIIPGIEQKQVKIIKGDAKSISIASASIIAKVTRDRIMDEEALKYPEYDFKENKGYGTAKHIEALKKFGPTPIHRRTFVQNFI